jgi:MFS transporter, FSR family, fosmidomycin resistance protein
VLSYFVVGFFMKFPPQKITCDQDVRTIGLVGLAHATSHFFQLMLAPLFPVLSQEFGLSYTQLGFISALFFIISGLGQAIAGFLVDRVGARPVLFGAMVCFVLSALAAASATGAFGLVLASMFAGLGNASFHPVDFTILNQRVPRKRLGYAFSVHGISGNLGWAAAPIFLAGVSALTGSWHWAVLAMGGWALLVLSILWLNREVLDDQVAIAGTGGAREIDLSIPAPMSISGAPKITQKNTSHDLSTFLKLPSLWICFSFFFFSTCTLTAVQNCASPAIQQLYGKGSIWLITGYMLVGALGMFIGGWLAGQVQRLERVLTAGLLSSAVLLFMVGRGVLPAPFAMLLVVLSGFGAGLAMPSRDMLIKKITPPGATGRVYGLVYCGLDLGFAVAAPIFGAMLDHHHPGYIFDGAAVTLVLSVLCASWVGAHVARTHKEIAVKPA